MIQTEQADLFVRLDRLNQLGKIQEHRKIPGQKAQGHPMNLPTSFVSHW
jgi:hypothetical protein